MEFIIYNHDTDQYELWTREETTPQSLETNNSQNRLRTSGTIVEIIDYKIEEFAADMVSELCLKNPCRKRVNQILYVSPVIKSKTGKSVHQCSEEHYNLPDRFRKENFQSILAVERGPFTRQRVGNQLLEAGTWFCYEVIFVGTPYECMEYAVSAEIEHFLMNDALNALTTSVAISAKMEILKKGIEEINVVNDAVFIRQSVKPG